MILNIGNCPLCKSPVKWDTEEDKCVFVKSSCLCEAPFPKLFMKVWRTYADFIDITYAHDLWKEGHEEGKKIGYAEGETEGSEEGYDEGYNIGYEEGQTAGYKEGRTDGYEEGHTDGHSDGYGEASCE